MKKYNKGKPSRGTINVSLVQDGTTLVVTFNATTEEGIQKIRTWWCTTLAEMEASSKMELH